MESARSGRTPEKLRSPSVKRVLDVEVSNVPVAGEFDTKPFAAGRFRLAYRGVYSKPPHKVGLPCVLKEEKSNRVWPRDSWKMTVKVHKIAKKMAEDFNKEKHTRMIVEYVDVFPGFVDRFKYAGGPREEKIFMIEDFIPGHFKKWCSNDGYISSESKLMPAFMHWSWVNSKGQKMIADLQGVRTEDRYILTDPVILSCQAGNMFGPTDTGVVGMALFFLNHHCTELCRGFPVPCYQDLFDILPEKLRTKLLTSASTSTAYYNQIFLPVEIAGNLELALKRYASGH